MITDDDTTPFFPSSESEGNGSSSKSRDRKRSFSSFFFNLPFIYFMVATMICILCALLSTLYTDFAYIISGIIGIITCGYALKHFRTLISLSATIDAFSQLNHKLKNQRNLIEQSVDSLSNCKGELNETHNRLVIVNERNRQNLNQFRGIQDNMEVFNATSLEQLQDVVNKSKSVEDRWHQEIYKHERHLLHTVFDRFCSNQHHIGMTRIEFDEFSRQLPVNYQRRFARMGTFDTIAANKDYILLEDFAKTLDIFAEMQANDCDIVFHIQSTSKKRKMSPKKSLTKRQNKYSLLQKLKSRGFSLRDEKLSDYRNISVDPDDDRKYDNDSLKYHGQVIITRRTSPGEKLQPSVLEELKLSSLSPDITTATGGLSYGLTLLSQRGFSSGSPAYQFGATRGNQLHRSTTWFKDEFITDLTAIEESGQIPNISNMNTVSIDDYNFTENQMQMYNFTEDDLLNVGD